MTLIKNQVKKLSGHGSFIKPLLVLKTKSKKSRLVGKVFKRYKGTMNAKEGVRIRQMINTYQKCLTIANIPTIETRTVLIPVKNGNYRLCQVQSFVTKENVLSNYLKNCTKSQAIDVIKQMAQVIKKLEEFNKTHKENIGMDLKPSNFALHEGKVTLLDLYPPLIKDGDSIKANDLLNHLRNKPLTKISLLAKTLTNQLIDIGIKKHFETDFLKRKLLWRFVKARPELISEFKTAIQKEVI